MYLKERTFDKNSNILFSLKKFWRTPTTSIVKIHKVVGGVSRTAVYLDADVNINEQSQILTNERTSIS